MDLPSIKDPITLSSQSFTKLSGPENFASFIKDVRQHLNSNFGLVGQDILANIETTVAPLGPAPKTTDLRISPITDLPIAGSRKYAQVTPSAEETAAAGFNQANQELTTAAQSLFETHTTRWPQPLNFALRRSPF